MNTTLTAYTAALETASFEMGMDKWSTDHTARIVAVDGKLLASGRGATRRLACAAAEEAAAFRAFWLKNQAP